jgi:hypothetical protein
MIDVVNIGERLRPDWRVIECNDGDALGSYRLYRAIYAELLGPRGRNSLRLALLALTGAGKLHLPNRGRTFGVVAWTLSTEPNRYPDREFPRLFHATCKLRKWTLK